ncbi:MAG: type II secretion system protein GspN [Desulfomonilia bacterium]|jgi:type II secretion system protein N
MAEGKNGSPLFSRTVLIAYALVCLAVFVVLRFPYDAFRGNLEQAMSSVLRQPVTLGHISYGFPSGLAVAGMSVGGSHFARELRLDSSLLQLFLGRLDLGVEALFDPGVLEGSIRTPLKSPGESLSASVRMDGLDARSLKVFMPPGMSPSGFVTGTVDIEGPALNLRELGGRASVTWKDGYLPLPGSLLPLGGIPFSSLEVRTIMEKGLITLEKMELSGDISGTVTGTVRLMEPLSRSRLNLTGELGLPPEMAALLGAGQGPRSGGTRFSLRGTLESPRFRVMNQ